MSHEIKNWIFFRTIHFIYGAWQSSWKIFIYFNFFYLGSPGACQLPDITYYFPDLYLFVTPLFWWRVCIRQGVIANVTWLQSHYVLVLPFLIHFQAGRYIWCLLSWFVSCWVFSWDIPIDCFSSLMICFIVDEVDCLLIYFLYLYYL